MPTDDMSLVGNHTLSFTMFSTNYGDSANIYSQTVEVKIELKRCTMTHPAVFPSGSDAVTITLEGNSVDPQAGVIDISDASYDSCELSTTVTGHENYHFITLV